MISSTRAVSWRRDLKTRYFHPMCPSGLPSGCLRHRGEHGESTGSTRSAGSTLARVKPVPISVSVSRLPRKRPCGTRLELGFKLQPGERAELIAATVTRDGSRSEPLSPVAVEATAAKSIKKAIGMLISVRSGRKFKARDHLERIMMRTALT